MTTRPNKPMPKSKKAAVARKRASKTINVSPKPETIAPLPVIEVMTYFNQRSTEGRVVINPPQSKFEV